MKPLLLLCMTLILNTNVLAQSIINSHGREVFYVRDNIIKPTKKNFVLLYEFEDSTIYKEGNQSDNCALYFIDEDHIKIKNREGSNLFSYVIEENQLVVKSNDGSTILVVDEKNIRRNKTSDRVLYHFDQRPPVWAIIALIHHYEIDSIQSNSY